MVVHSLDSGAGDDESTEKESGHGEHGVGRSRGESKESKSQVKESKYIKQRVGPGQAGEHESSRKERMKGGRNERKTERPRRKQRKERMREKICKRGN